MSLLKPNATYVYERQGGTVYAREMGAPAETRFAIGYDWELDTNPARVKGSSLESIRENQYWHKILIESQNNPVLRESIERVKIIYEMSKKDGQE